MQPTKATRLVFEYDGDELRLVAQQQVEMIVPPAAAATRGPGYYLDTRDANGRTLMRVAAPAAFSTSTEVFPERHEDPITRVDLPRRQGAFTVTLPVVDEADHVTMVRIGGPRPRTAADQRDVDVVDLATFPLARR